MILDILMKKNTKTKRGSMNGGRWIRPEKRLAINLRDRFICVYCLTDLHDADPRDVTLDHVKCRSNGGTNNESNLITACRSCNSSRQDRPLSRFAGPETVKHVRRNTSRSLKKYLKLAKAILADEVGGENF